MLRAREITKTNQNKSYYKGRNGINQNGVIYTQNSKSRDFATGGEFLYIAKFPEIAKFSTVGIVHQCWLLFHCSLLLVFHFFLL